MPRLINIGVRADSEGMGFELFNVDFGATCGHQVFQGHYDIWPFCKPYNAEEWWIFLDEPDARRAAVALAEYLWTIREIVCPPRIGFVEDAEGFHLCCNGGPVGPHLYKGEDDKNNWPFKRSRNWPHPADRAEAMKSMLRLQSYLDGRTVKLVKTKKK